MCTAGTGRVSMYAGEGLMPGCGRPRDSLGDDEYDGEVTGQRRKVKGGASGKKKVCKRHGRGYEPPPKEALLDYDAVEEAATVDLDGVEFGDEVMHLRWMQDDEPHLPVDQHALQVLNRLAQAPQCNITDLESRGWIASMQAIARGFPYSDAHAAFTSNSVAAIALRCRRTFDVRGAVDFSAMLNLVQLVVKTDRCVPVLRLLVV